MVANQVGQLDPPSLVVQSDCSLSSARSSIAGELFLIVRQGTCPVAGFNGSNRLTIEPMWFDEELVKIEVRVTTDDWRGVACSYSTIPDLVAFAEQLRTFPEDSQIPIVFQAGFANIDPAIRLRFSEFDNAGHIGVYVELKSDVERDSRTACISVAIKTEFSCVDRFRRQLLHLAQYREGVATLISE